MRAHPVIQALVLLCSLGFILINLIVDDLDGMLARVRQSGTPVMDEIDENEFGRFGWFVDPDGNKVELWEPAGDE